MNCTIQDECINLISHAAVLHLFLVAESFVGKGRYIKKIRMHGRGRFGIQEKKFCHYFLVLKEGTGKEKNIKRRLKHMNELEEIQRHPRHIVNSLAWWWNKSDWILLHNIWSSAQVARMIQAYKVWESVMLFSWEKERKGKKKKEEKKRTWRTTMFTFPTKNKELVVSFLIFSPKDVKTVHFSFLKFQS